MTNPSTTSADAELIARFRELDQPLLPALHAFHERDGFLSEDAIRAVAKGLGTPLADLWGTVTFYHHLARVPGGFEAPRVCTGPVCARRGGLEILEALRKDGATPMPCSGRCDVPVPVLKGNATWAGTSADTLRPAPESPLPAPNPGLAAGGAGLGSFEECVFSQIREPGRATLEGYRRTGGYEALAEALRGTPEQVRAVVTDSKLAGRGGAGFPTGIKWTAVAEAEGDPKSVVCNADEGEPGCFKDRVVMDHDPHALIEGMVLAAFATGAVRGFVYLRYEYPETQVILERALAEARSEGLLGSDIGGRKGFSFDIHIRRGAGAYICGEEGSLLNSLEGKHPFPRNRPPFPVTHGLDDKPTVVNNVETLAAVPQILRRGAAWYRGLGLGDNAGTKLISLSGDVRRPGNYEVPFGLPLRTLLHDWAGGPAEGRALQAVTMAGLSGGFLAGADLDEAVLTEADVRVRGSMMGAAGIMAFDDTRDIVQVGQEMMEFFAHESCGKCFPCRIGTQRLTERLAAEAGPRDLESWRDEVTAMGETMKATSACGLGMGAPLVTDSLLRYFADKVDARLQGG